MSTPNGATQEFLSSLSFTFDTLLLRIELGLDGDEHLGI
jgi:hypothetical protein